MPDQVATGIWIYFTAPLLGMLVAAEVYVRLKGKKQLNAPSCTTTTTFAASFGAPTVNKLR
jgi:hypothetical protein